MLHTQEFMLGTSSLRGHALDQWWASTVVTWISPIGQRRTRHRYGRLVEFIGFIAGCLCQGWETITCRWNCFLFQVYHNNVLEFYIVTADENECNWMMFVRKARCDSFAKGYVLSGVRCN